MFENEHDFKKIVDRLDIDVKPNSGHRENLRCQILSAFSQSTQAGTFWQSVTKSPITKLAAAALILIAIAIFVARQRPPEQSETSKAPKVAKSAAGLTTVISLEAAYRRGGFEAVEQQCDEAVRVLGARLDGISAGQLIRDFNIEKREREKP